jgi:peroxiredoxin
MLQPGAAAPAIELPDIDGTTQTPLSGLGKGPLVVAFYKVGCPTCQLTLPFLERLAGSVSLVGVSQDDARDSREFNERCGITFPTLLDARPYPASNAYQITYVPSLFVIESDGRVSFAVNGFSKAALEKLGDRFGVPVFRDTDHVPELRPG